MTIKKLARGTLVYGLGEVVSRLLTVLLLPIFTAYLSPSDYGVVSILTALSVFVTSLFSLGLGAAIAPVYFEGDNRIRKDTTICTTVVLLAASVVVLVGAGVTLSSSISRLLFDVTAYARLVILSLATSACTILTIPFRQYLQFEERAKSYVALSALSVVITTVLSLWMVVGLNRGVDGMLEAGLIGQAIGLVLFITPCVMRIKLRAESAIGLELLRLSLPLLPAFGFVFVLQHGGKYQLQWFRGLEEVGVYTIGFNLGLVISVVVTAFQSAWIPYFMSFAGRPGEARVVYGRVLTYYVLAVGTLTLGVFAIARPVVLLMTVPAYHEAWTVVGVTATAQFLAGICIVLLPGMYLAKEVQYIALLQGIAAATVVLLGLLLIPPFGVPAAAASLVASYVVLAAIQYAWNRYRKYVTVSYEWKRLGRLAVVYVLYAAAALWKRELAIQEELLFSGLLVAVLPILVYGQLDAVERGSLLTWGRSIFDPGAMDHTAGI